MVERRKFRRLKVEQLNAICSVVETGQDFPIDIIDITPEGIGFNSPLGLFQGNSLRINMLIDGMDVIFAGKVRWMKTNHIGDRKIGGMYITEISEYVKSLMLLKYTDLLMASYPEPEISN